MALTLAVTVAVLLNGSVSLLAQAAVLLLLAISAGAAAVLPRARLERRRETWTAALWLPVVLLLVATPHLPLPPAITAWAMPGRSQGMTSADAVTGAMPWLTAAMVGIVTATVVRRRRARHERPAAVALLAIVALAALQRGLQLEDLYGVLPVRAHSPWAPLVNANFVATLAIGLLPVTLGGALRRPRPDHVWTWVCGLASLAGAILVALTGSMGALLGLGTAGIAALILRFLPRWRGIAPAIGVAIAASVAWPAARLEQAWGSSRSLDQRLAQWRATWQLFQDHWLLGVGPGRYAETFPAYQPPYPFVVFDHAHSDPLEWLVELGVVGVLMVGIVATIIRATRRVPAGDSRRPWILLGLLAVLVQSCVDFPLHLPGLLVSLVAALHLARPARTSTPLAHVGPLRVLLGAVSALTLGSTAWLVFADRVERQADALMAASITSHEQAAELRAIAPWRPEPDLARARTLARDPAGASEALELATRVVDAHPADPEVLLQAGAVVTHLRQLDLAEAWLRRATVRHRADHRPWALLSRIAQARDDNDRALDAWTEALKRWPVSLIARDAPFDRALRLMPIGVYWVDALDDGSSPALSMHLAQALIRREDWSGALLALEQGERERRDYALYPHKGRVLVELGFLDEGLAHLASADEADDDGLARRWRARALLDHGRFDEAMHDARSSLREDPGNAETALILLDAAEGAGGPEAVVQAYDNLPTGIGHDPEVVVRAARAAADAGLWSRCVDLLESQGTPPPGSALILGACLEACPLCGR